MPCASALQASVKRTKPAAASRRRTTVMETVVTRSILSAKRCCPGICISLSNVGRSRIVYLDREGCGIDAGNHHDMGLSVHPEGPIHLQPLFQGLWAGAQRRDSLEAEPLGHGHDLRILNAGIAVANRHALR